MKPFGSEEPMGPFVGESLVDAVLAAARAAERPSGLTLSLPRAADEVDTVVVDVDDARRSA